MRGMSFLCQGGYMIIRTRNFKMLETLNQGLFYTQSQTVHLLPISPHCSLHQIICVQSSQNLFIFFTVWALSAISGIIYLIVQSKSKLMCMTVSVSRWAFTDPPTQLPAELMAQLTLLGVQWDLMALALTIELILTSRSCWRTDEPYCLQPNMHKSITNAV